LHPKEKQTPKAKKRKLKVAWPNPWNMGRSPRGFIHPAKGFEQKRHIADKGMHEPQRI
jgi:hypothetical protein